MWSFPSFFILISRTGVIEDADEKTLIIMTQMDAVGRYVKEELRPKMFEVLPKVSREEDFVVEAMSTTHVRHRIMEEVQQRFKGLHL